MDVIKKFLDTHVLTGIILGVVLGLHYPFDAYKGILVALALVMSVSLVVKTK